MKKLQSIMGKKQAQISTPKIIRYYIGLLLIISIVVFVYFLSGIKKTEEYSKPYEPIFTKNGELYFLKKDKPDTLQTINIEIADTNEKRLQGLMWRRSMANNDGMLFIFQTEKYLSFWMKNTYIPLDIIYIDKNYKIVTIRENTFPLSEKPIPSMEPAKYVVEVNAGYCSGNKIEKGDRINFNRK